MHGKRELESNYDFSTCVLANWRIKDQSSKVTMLYKSNIHSTKKNTLIEAKKNNTKNKDDISKMSQNLLQSTFAIMLVIFN